MKCQVNVAILYTYSRSLNVSTLFYSLFHLPNVVDIYSYSSLDVLNVLKTFPAVFWRILLRRFSVASKPRDCGFELHWWRNFLFV